MRFLFVHQNFPGQFKFLAPELVRLGHEVVAMPVRADGPSQWNGVRLAPYRVARGTTEGVHPWVSDFETKVIRAEACFRAALELRAQGFVPDVIIAHHGWGESLFLKDVWPQARLGIYCEFYYRQTGLDVGFDPEFRVDDPGDVCRVRLKNVNNLLHFQMAEAGLSPTLWQADSFPQPFRSRISVVHDGIDTRHLLPKAGAALNLQTPQGEGLTLTRSDEVVTFVNRHLEPYRGYHVFMRALPELLRRRPNARVLIVGGDGVSYGSADTKGRRWKQVYIDEVRPLISDDDWARVHFLGNLPYRHFIEVLRLSTVHVYLTYPFVLSWSLLEAMSLGCAIVGSDTGPVREVIDEGQSGRLVPFFDHARLSDVVCELLDHPAERMRLGANARAVAVQRFDLQTVCLPRQLEWVRRLAVG